MIFTAKNKYLTKVMKEPRTWTDSLDKRPKPWNMDMKFGLWNVRSLYRAGSLITALRELPRYKLDLRGCRKSDGRALASNLLENTHFSTESGMKIMN
jgi:hypothetical protein